MSSSEDESSSSSGGSSSSEEEVVVKKTKGKRKAPASSSTVKIKRPLSAYMYFSKEQRPLLKAGNPELGFGDIGKLVGANWRALPINKRDKYQKQTDLDKLRYEREKKENPDAVQTTKKGKTARAPKKKQLGPKKPLTSYMFYMQEERPAVLQDHPDFKFSEIGKEVGRRWKAIEPTEKARFQKQADEAKVKYLTDHATWKEDFPEEFEEMEEQKKKKSKAPPKKKQKVATPPASESDSSSGSGSESSSDDSD